MMDSTLGGIPPEILLRICEHLAYTSVQADPSARAVIYLDVPDLVNLTRTSRKFRNVANDPALHLPDLVQRGFMRGLGIERRWRAGLYIYSPQSVTQYETSLRLQRTHVRHFLTLHINARPLNPLQLLHRVLPDVESFSPRISRSLLPVVHKLKWCIQKDQLAKKVREHGGLKEWLEDRSWLVVRESERVRLAICPGIRKAVGFYEGLSRAGTV